MTRDLTAEQVAASIYGHDTGYHALLTQRDEHNRWVREWSAAWAGIGWLHCQDVYSRQQYAATMAFGSAVERMRAQLDNLRIDVAVAAMRKALRKGQAT